MVFQSMVFNLWFLEYDWSTRAFSKLAFLKQGFPKRFSKHGFSQCGFSKHGLPTHGVPDRGWPMIVESLANHSPNGGGRDQCVQSRCC